MKKKKRIDTIKKWINKLYHKQEVCYICKEELSTDNENNGIVSNKKYKARNYCHYTDRYGGASHNICNLRKKKLKENPKSCSLS